MHTDRRAYCCVCKASTVWRHESNVYVCVGDDEKHPERRVHGCGTKVAEDKFQIRKRVAAQ